MANGSQLQTWRKQAAPILQALIVSEITGTALTTEDGLVDDLLRELAGRSPRPLEREPYLGLFAAAPVPDLRQRAAGGVRIYLERVEADNFIPADHQTDSLIRTLKTFSNRPLGVLPYEGLLGRQDANVGDFQRDAWRQKAAQHLSFLVRRIPDPTSIEADELADDLLRALGGQPSRPAGREPYRGLFLVPTDASILDLRPLAANGIKIFVERINTQQLGSQDAVVDAVIRKIKDLPDRPAHRLPYEGLFPKTNAVTAEQLRQIAPFGSRSQIERLTPHLNTAMNEFEINTPLRRAHFLAQVAHESGEFNYVEEIASGAAYENRRDLGNTQPGDGVRFKGRGLIQITGRFNYQACGAALGVDLINNPTRLADDDLAARSAGWFWDWQQINPAADRDDVETVTYIINGGYNGFQDRVNKLAAAKKAFGIV